MGQSPLAVWYWGRGMGFSQVCHSHGFRNLPKIISAVGNSSPIRDVFTPKLIKFRIAIVRRKEPVQQRDKERILLFVFFKYFESFENIILIR